MTSKYEMDMTNGPLFKKIIIYALPLILTNLLQLLFQAADVVIVGNATNGVNQELAATAVSTTGTITTLVIGLFIGLSIGANVILAHSIGEKNINKARRVVSTSIFMSIVFGVLLVCFCVPLARKFLSLINCNEEVLPLATTYLQLYFAGLPIILLYNFASSILRAVGDTKRPLIYLAISGVINVGLNAFFVFVLKLDVEGVALATLISQAISATLSIIALIKSDGACHLDIKHLRLYKEEFIEIVKVGLPSGLQSCIFAISNIFIQADINAFGQAAQSANGLSSQIDGFTYNAMLAISHTAAVFVSQNSGALKYKRIKRSIIYCCLTVSVVGLTFATIMYLFSDPLIAMLGAKSAETIEIIKLRLVLLGFTYFMCGVMDTLANSLRSLGKSVTAMVISLFFCCGVRLLWLATVVKYLWNSVTGIYFIYPLTWLLAVLTYIIILIPLLKKQQKQHGNE